MPFPSQNFHANPNSPSHSLILLHIYTLIFSPYLFRQASTYSLHELPPLLPHTPSLCFSLHSPQISISYNNLLEPLTLPANSHHPLQTIQNSTSYLQPSPPQPLSRLNLWQSH